MSQAPTAGPGVPGPGATASGLVRVTVASGTRRVDLVLPGAVPVAELVPELARSVGLLDATTVYGGYRLVTVDGRELSSDAGLTIQGVEDGGVITVTAGVSDLSPRVYDDVVEAMADVVERDLKPWSPETGRRTALSAAGLLMALGALALLIQHESTVAVAAAGLVALALVVGAIVLSRGQDEPDAAVAVAWMGTGYAAIAGLMWALPDGRSDLWHDDFFGYPVAAAGGAALLAGVVALVGLGEGRTLVIPPIVVGAIFVGAGLATEQLDLDAAVCSPAPWCSSSWSAASSRGWPWARPAPTSTSSTPSPTSPPTPTTSTPARSSPMRASPTRSWSASPRP